MRPKRNHLQRDTIWRNTANDVDCPDQTLPEAAEQHALEQHALLVSYSFPFIQLFLLALT